MISLVESSLKNTAIEKTIFISNTKYTSIAYKKTKLEDEDIVTQYNESKELKTQRYLVSKDGNIIGIIEYGMESPRAKKPWLTLLIIDSQYQGQGYAKETYYAYENKMRNIHVKCIQIAVHATNEKALTFWTALGFVKYDERIFEGDRMYSLEKQLM
ncbi:GNAT family N-acetyltransferase [Ornithinibacillus californiensis]|uniref:GNAT family N-acetyltransferase n=1 Tax=Ornithinibacillus californiensis TaxID=161536 RepID=UPI00064DBDBC|nr:GNAT family N-acetyltransferase [Ornithinibacillus californiensis]